MLRESKLSEADPSVIISPSRTLNHFLGGYTLNSTLPDLLGKPDREQIIKEELEKVDVTLEHKPNSLFPAIGKLGSFTFVRGPQYWIVTGEVPLSLALEIYSKEELRPFVMAAGLDEKIRPDIKGGSKQTYIRAKKGTTKGKTGTWVIPFYGITSIEGLEFFVSFLKTNSLV